MMLDYLEISPQTLMQKHGKSFYFASKVFDHGRLIKVSLLYSICRYIDDCADELPTIDARNELFKLQLVLNNKTGQSNDFANSANRLIELGVNKNALLDLLDGAIFDVEGGTIQTEAQFMKYCYQVAGAVGLMMCPLLDIRSANAQAFAVDLGIAMQITNICRDVREDAINGRVYIPQNKLEKAGVRIEQMKGGDTPLALRKIVRGYLVLAESYYNSAIKGLKYIPLRSRFAIFIALCLYRGIGRKILKRDCQVLQGRVYLNKFEKVWLTLISMPKFFTILFKNKAEHDPSLHRDLNFLKPLLGSRL